MGVDLVLLLALDCFNRLDHLELNARRLRAAFPDAALAVYFNGPDPREIRGRVPGGVRILTGPNSGPHNGVRDACNAFLPLLDGQGIIVRLHADAHVLEMDPLRDAIGSCGEGTVRSAPPHMKDATRLDDLEAPCEHLGGRSMPYVNCHLWIAAAGDYRRMLPLDVDCSGSPRADGEGLGIEVNLGIRARACGIRIRPIYVPLLVENGFSERHRELS